jgi:hypothetical protein
MSWLFRERTVNNAMQPEPRFKKKMARVGLIKRRRWIRGPIDSLIPPTRAGSIVMNGSCDRAAGDLSRRLGR